MPMTKPTSEQVTFLAAGAGATQRTALDKLRDVVSVKDFGAVGDGVADDTAAIQAALNNNASAVYVPAGSYKVTAQINVPANSVLYGDGVPTELFMATSLATMVSITANNIALMNMSFRGTNTAIPAAGPNEILVSASSANNVVVDGCQFRQTVIGLQFAACANIKTSRCHFDTILSRDDGTQGYGILCNSNTTDGIIGQNSFYDMGRHAVYVSSGSSRITVSNNVIQDCNSVAINLGAFTGQNQVQDISITSNIIRSIAGATSPHGISVAQKCGFINISSNLIRTVGSYGISIEGSAANSTADNPTTITISGNTCISCDTGIRIYNANSVSCIGNTIESATAVGINASSDAAGTGAVSSHIRISNNTITNSGTYGLLLAGSASSTNYFVEGNIVTNSTTADYWTPTLNGSTLPASSVVYGDARMQFTFTATGLTASQTNVDMTGAAAGFVEYVIPSDMYALVNAARHTSALTAGTATITLTKNGSNQTAYNITLNSTNQSGTSNQGLRVRYNAGDRIGMRYTTDSAYSASGAATVQAQIELVKASA